jgi:hypothetical protein
MDFCGACIASASHILGALEKSQDGVSRLVPCGASLGDPCACEALPHHLDIGLGVTMGRGNLSVSEPRLDRHKIDACPKELHRQCMAKNVGRNAHSWQGGA